MDADTVKGRGIMLVIVGAMMALGLHGHIWALYHVVRALMIIHHH
jgi:hypothetical protein